MLDKSIRTALRDSERIDPLHPVAKLTESAPALWEALYICTLHAPGVHSAPLAFHRSIHMGHRQARMHFNVHTHAATGSTYIMDAGVHLGEQRLVGIRTWVIHPLGNVSLFQPLLP